MPNVGIRQLKSQTSEILRRVQDGEEFIVTRRGKPCAKLTAAAAPPPPESPDSLEGRFRDWPDATWEDIQDAKRIWHRISDPKLPDE